MNGSNSKKNQNGILFLELVDSELYIYNTGETGIAKVLGFHIECII